MREEPLCGRRIPAGRDQHVDHLTVLIDRTVQVDPAASDLDAGLVDKPALTGRVAGGPCGVKERRGEPLHPPVDSHVINLDAAFGQKFLDVAVRQAIAQLPAHRDRDHLTREPVPRWRTRRRP
jgi:hypothetical protein